MHWTIIHNPRSCSGKSAAKWPEIERRLQSAGIAYERHETRHAGHAIELAAGLIAAGARNLVAVGGDGTVNEVVNGIFRQQAVPASEIRLTQIPIGTGNDWRRTMGIPHQLAESIAMLQDPAERSQDVGVVDYMQAGQPMRRYFVNVAGMGFEAAVGLRANAQKASGKGGILGYYPALVSCLAGYECTEATIGMADKQLHSRPFFNLAIGICKFNGGGMKQCPDASVDDGLFDLTLINKTPKMVVVANVPRLFNGSFVKIKYVEQHRTDRLTVQTGPETLLEVDGENIGEGTAAFILLPKALRVVVPQPR